MSLLRATSAGTAVDPNVLVAGAWALGDEAPDVEVVGAELLGREDDHSVMVVPGGRQLALPLDLGGPPVVDVVPCVFPAFLPTWTPEPALLVHVHVAVPDVEVRARGQRHTTKRYAA